MVNVATAVALTIHAAACGLGLITGRVRPGPGGQRRISVIAQARTLVDQALP